MTRTRLILAIRCVTLLAVGALLFGQGWLYAGASVAVLGLMMPVFAVLNPGCPGCTGGAPDSVQIVITGIVDGTGSGCSFSNGTFVASFVSGTITTGCYYNYTGFKCPNSGIPDCSWQHFMSYNSFGPSPPVASHTTLFSNLQPILGQGGPYLYFETSSYDCTSTTITYSTCGDNCSDACDCTAMSGVVTPL